MCRNRALEHHAFGMMLGRTAKPFKTRPAVPSSWPNCWMKPNSAPRIDLRPAAATSADEQAEVVHAVPWARSSMPDLSKNRTTDYIFDWDPDAVV